MTNFHTDQSFTVQNSKLLKTKI